MSSMKIIRNLPPAPPYHKAVISPKVAGYKSKHIRVLDHAPKPSPAVTPHTSKPRPSNIHWTDDKLMELGRMYDNGVPLKDIAEHFDYTDGAISKYVQRARDRGYIKTERQYHRSWTAEEDDITITMIKEGHATDVIAKKLGRSRSSVINHVRALQNWGKLK